MVEIEIGSVSVSLITILCVAFGVCVMCCCCFLLAPTYSKVNQAREVPWGGKNYVQPDDDLTRSNSEKEESKASDLSIA